MVVSVDHSSSLYNVPVCGYTTIWPFCSRWTWVVLGFSLLQIKLMSFGGLILGHRTYLHLTLIAIAKCFIQSGCTNLNSHRQRVGVPVTSFPYSPLELSLS